MLNFVYLLMFSFFLCNCGAGHVENVNSLETNAPISGFSPSENNTSNELKPFYIRKGGWPIPKSVRQTFLRRSLTSATTNSGYKVVVDVLSYLPEPELDISNVFDELGVSGWSETKVKRISELSVNGRIFSYHFTISRSFNDVNVNSPPNRGVIVSYSYVDADGDGKFERMVFSGDASVVPDWIALESD